MGAGSLEGQAWEKGWGEGAVLVKREDCLSLVPGKQKKRKKKGTAVGGFEIE